MLTYWMDEHYQLFVRKDGEEWDEQYITDVLATPPPEKSEKVKKLTGSAIMEWYLNSLDGGDKYRIITLDDGETWADKEEDIKKTLKEWRRRKIENHA